MIVYLLRHGIAEEGFGAPDAARRLTDEGRKKLERAGKTWQRLVPRVDLVLHSPLVRAAETAQLLCRALDARPRIEVVEDLVPSAPPVAMQERLQAELLAGTAAVACVGHEPHLGSLFGLLATGNAQTSIPLKKGMLVAIELESSAHMIGKLAFALGQKVAAQC